MCTLKEIPCKNMKIYWSLILFEVFIYIKKT